MNISYLLLDISLRERAWVLDWTREGFWNRYDLGEIRVVDQDNC